MDPTATRTPARFLGTAWSNPRIGLAIAAAIVAAFALTSAWITPRGPITTIQALTSMVAAIGVGVAVGLTMANRWALFAAPAVFIVIFELARLGATGITVDAIHLDSMFGIIAFVVGRFAHGVIVLLPLGLGSVLGSFLAGRLGNVSAPRLGSLGWTVVGITSVFVGVVAISIARPASTQPIIGADGSTVPGSVAELTTVSIGGHDQVLMIRGRSIDNPVLLYLAGGPGGTDIGAMRSDVTLEQDFIVVTWDQRGTGKSYPALDPTNTLTLDQMISDTVEVTRYLQDRFGQEKIYLVGNSWGSTLGVLAAQQHPELYHAFVGIGQMVSQRETDVMFWEDTLAWAEDTGNDGLAATLRDFGPPPYDDIRRYEHGVSHEHDWNTYPEFDSGNEMPAILFVPEYNWMERINGFRGFLDSAAVLYPQLQDIDFRIDVPSLEIQFYMVQGEHEARGRAVLADEWFDMLDAPHKHRFVIDGAGHRAHFDQPDEFAAVMAQVLAETAANTAGGGA